MRLLIQRVNHAKVEVEHKTIGQISFGYLIFLGIHQNDTFEICDQVAEKIKNLRIFADDLGKMNLTLSDVKGSMLLVSQFTLYGTVKKHNRPSFTASAKSEHALPLYHYLIDKLKADFHVETGTFGAHMHVESSNDGPVSILIQIGDNVDI